MTITYSQFSEVKEGKYYTKALDMFSLGSVFYTLLTKDYLPPKQKQFNLITILGKVMGMQSVQALDEEVRNNLKDLLSGMLCSERDRIKLEGLQII
jgi:serine/threonine protein kinase